MPVLLIHGSGAAGGKGLTGSVWGRDGAGGSTGRGWPGTRSDTCVNTGDPHAGEVTQVCRDTQRGTCMAHARNDARGHMHKPLTYAHQRAHSTPSCRKGCGHRHAPTHVGTRVGQEHRPQNAGRTTHACRHAQVTAPHCCHTCTLAPPAGEGQDFLGATGESPALQGAGQRQAQQLQELGGDDD